MTLEGKTSLNGDRSATVGDSRGETFANQYTGIELLKHEAAIALSSPSNAGEYGALKASGNGSLVLANLTIEDRTALGKPVEQGSLGPTKTLTDLIQSKLIIDRTSPVRESPECEILMPGKSPRIKVVFENLTTSTDIKPDFVVGRDGKVEMINNPESPPKAEIVIQLSRGEGQLRPANVQQIAVDELAQYLSTRFSTPARESTSHKTDSQQSDARRSSRTKIEDPRGLVSDKTKHEMAPQLPADQLPGPTRHQVERMNCFRGSGHGSMSGNDASDYFPRREVPRQLNESRPLMALKDTVAGMFNPEKRHPYDTIRSPHDGGFAVGRYGLSSGLIFSWLGDQEEFGEIMGNPPTWNKIGKLMDSLAKKHKVPKEFASKFKNHEFTEGFLKFLNKLEAGADGTMTRRELHAFLPKKVQEQVASQLVEKFASKSDGHPEDVVLAMQLGKPIERLANEDKQHPSNQQFMDAAMKMFGLALAKHETRRSEKIEWEDGGDGSPLALKVARAAERRAAHTNTVGWCYRGVASTLERFGISLAGRSAYMAAGQLANNSRVQEVSMQDLRPGDILVHGKSGSHKHGHIAVYLGHDREASDHVQHLISGRGYGGTRVFRIMA